MNIAQVRQVMWFLARGYSAERTAELTRVPLAYVKVMKEYPQ